MTFFIREKKLLPFFSTGLLNNFLHKNSLHILFIDCNTIYLYDLNKYLLYKHTFSSKIITFKEFYNSELEKYNILIVLKNEIKIISCNEPGFKIMHSIYFSRQEFFTEENRPENIYQIDACNFIYCASLTHFILFNCISLKQRVFMWNDFHSDLKFTVNIFADEDILFFQTANKKLISAKFMQQNKNKFKILQVEERHANCIIFSAVKIFFFDDCIKFKSIFNEKIMHFNDLIFFNFHYFFLNENILFILNGDGNILKVTYETNGRYIDNIDYAFVNIAGVNGKLSGEGKEKINNKYLNGNNKYYSRVEYKKPYLLIITEKIFLIKIYAEENKIMQKKIFDISPPEFLNTCKFSIANIIDFFSIQKIRTIKKITDSQSVALFKNSILFFSEKLNFKIREFAENIRAEKIFTCKNYIIILNSENYIFTKENFRKRIFTENDNHLYLKNISIEKIYENGKYVVFMTEKIIFIADENMHKIREVELVGAVDQSYFFNASLFLCMKNILSEYNLETEVVENLFLCKILIRLDEKELIYADPDDIIYFYAHKNIKPGRKKIKNDSIKIQNRNYFLSKKFTIENINEPIRKIELIDLPIDDSLYIGDRIEYNISLSEERMENILLVFTDNKLFTFRDVNGYFMRDNVLFIEENHTVLFSTYFYFISPNIFIGASHNGISYVKSEIEINFLCENYCIIDTHIFSYKLDNYAFIGDHIMNRYLTMDREKNFKNILFNERNQTFLLLNISTGYKFTMKAPEDRKVELIEDNSTEISTEEIEHSSIFNNFFYEVILYSHNFNFISKHKFSCNEIITDYKFLLLNNGQEKKDYLVISTSVCRGENLQSTGRLVIFELIGVPAKINKPFSNKKLKLVTIEETRLPITALCEIRNNIAVSIGTKIMVYRLDLNEGLTPVAFHDMYILTNNIISVKNFLIASDILKGVFFFYYQSEPLMIHLLGQSKNIKFAKDALYFSSKKIMHKNKNILCEKNEELFFAISTEKGRILFYTYSPYNIFSKGGKELIFRGEYKTPYKLNKYGDGFYTENGNILTFDFYAMHDENINFYLKQFLNKKNIREHTFYENIIVINDIVQHYLYGNSCEKLDEIFSYFLK